MKKAAVIKDALRGMPHVVIVDDGFEFKSFPVTEFGRKIAENSIFKNSIDTKSLPDGFISTGFKTISKNIEDLIGQENFLESKPETIDTVFSSNIKSGKKFELRKKNMQKFAAIGISEKNLTLFKTVKDKETILNFKARNFYNKIMVSSLLSSIKSGKIGVDTEKMAVTYNKNVPLSQISAEIATSKIPEGVIRRSFFKQDENSTKSSKRALRRAKSLSSEMPVETKTGYLERIYSSPMARMRRHG